MKSLIIGAQGLVGSALARLLPDALQGVVQRESINNKQVYIDLIHYQTLFNVFSSFRPDIVYLAGAITDVNKCEDFGTSVVNVKGSTNVLRLCEKFHSKLVFYSSSYLFDGIKNTPYVEGDTPNPIQMYGKQKLIMENLIQTSDVDYLIVRTVGVFGIDRKKTNFAQQVLSAVFAGKDVFAPNDQFVNPVLSDDLARISIILANDVQGLFHVAGDTCVSKYEFAKRIAGYFEYADKVKPLTTTEMNQKALRPSMGCLDCHKIQLEGIPIPSLDLGTQRFLENPVG